MRMVPTGPSGGSGGDEVQRVAVRSSVGWEGAGPQEAKASGRGGEYGGPHGQSGVCTAGVSECRLRDNPLPVSHWLANSCFPGACQ